MKAVPGYTKILTIGSAMTENALVGHVVIQEKVDGSLFRFGINEDGEVTAGSKGQIFYDLDDVAQMFVEGAQYIKSISDKLKKLPVDTYFYCEYLQKPKHNTLVYDHVPKNHLVLFDCLMGGKWCNYKELQVIANGLDIDAIPVLYSGLATTDTIKGFLETPSYLGKQIVEGVVIKNYDQTIMLGGHVFPLFTKYVREAFKELHTQDWKIRQPKDSLHDYVEGFKSEARWQKAIIHLREKGELLWSPKDIGNLIKTIQEDILVEETENIKNFLFKCFKDDILRAATRRFPEWYKEQLLGSLDAKEKNEIQS
jgi:hypothetical protein